MKRLKLLSYLMFLLVLCAGMTGCFEAGEIISASPDPDETVQLAFDDKQQFSVESNPGFYKYTWYIDHPDQRQSFQSTNTYQYTVDPEHVNNKNLTIISVNLMTFKRTCDMTGPCWWGWRTTDSRLWEIKLTQNPPVWQGDYIIENSSDIEALRNYNEITGSLIIEGYYSLTSLDGISNISSIGGGLIIENNNTLTNLDGLSSELTLIGGNLDIIDNNTLTSLYGISNISSIGGDLIIENNDILTNLDGLSSELTSIGGNLNIKGNNALTSLDGLSSLCGIGEYHNFGSFEDSIVIVENVKLCTTSAEALVEQILSCDPEVFARVAIFGNKTCP